MKLNLQIRILLIAFLAISAISNAQVFQTNNTPYKFRGVKGDSLMIIPIGCDTPLTQNPKWGTATDGAMFLKTCDTTLWVKMGQRYVQVNGVASITGGDTTIFEVVLDSTGQQNDRVLFSRNNHISSSPKILIDSANSRLIINNSNVSIGGAGMQLYVVGNGTFAGFLRVGTFEIYGITTPVTDTTIYKPLAINSSGSVRKLDRWPGSGGTEFDSTSISNRIDASYYDIEQIDSFSYAIQRPNATEDTIEIVSTDVSGLDLSGKVSVPTVSGNLVYWPTIPTAATLTSITLSGSAAVSQSGGELTMTGIGSVATTNIINIPIDMSIEQYTETITFRANKTTGTQRIGLGTRASNFRNSAGTAKAYSWTFDASSGADAGESFFFTGANGTFTQRDQTAALAFSNGDTIELTVRRDGYTFYCKSKNVTTDDSLTLTYSYPVTSTSGPVLPPTSRPCIYQLNQANQVLLSWTLTNDAAVNPYLMIIGDSKTSGYNTTTESDRFVSLLQTAHADSVVAASGFGDETGDAIKWLNIIQRVRPQNLIIALGSNDVRNSVTGATIALNLTAIKNAADIVSCNVYFLGMNETSLNQSYLWQFANATFGIDRCILTYPALAGDGVHLTTAGHLTVKNAIDAILF